MTFIYLLSIPGTFVICTSHLNSLSSGYGHVDDEHELTKVKMSSSVEQQIQPPISQIPLVGYQVKALRKIAGTFVICTSHLNSLSSGYGHVDDEHELTKVKMSSSVEQQTQPPISQIPLVGYQVKALRKIA
ncbi:hypothetical protein AVEN_176480-1, partial [Araneus ventricosus]